MTESPSLGEAFARALAAKDSGRLRELMHPEIDFRGLTPSRTWEASGPDEAITIIFGSWYEEMDKIESLDRLECDSFADRERVGYRLSVQCPDGHYVVEQQAYLEERDDRIGWMRVVCSGYRPVRP